MPDERAPHTIRVTIEILNEDGDPVNSMGWLPRKDDAWRTESKVKGFQDIKPTTERAQAIWSAVDSIVKLVNA